MASKKSPNGTPAPEKYQELAENIVSFADSDLEREIAALNAEGVEDAEVDSHTRSGGLRRAERRRLAGRRKALERTPPPEIP
ncbi:MAG TPA: hypothetical protein VFN18_04135 [Solirubrobacterales bacterium]|nr:hypothetical protein [Solirubrobacterales bacterium]